MTLKGENMGVPPSPPNARLCWSRQKLGQCKLTWLWRRYMLRQVRLLRLAERESGRLKLAQERKRTLLERSQEIAAAREAEEGKHARLENEFALLQGQVDAAGLEGARCHGAS